MWALAILFTICACEQTSWHDIPGKWDGIRVKRGDEDLGVILTYDHISQEFYPLKVYGIVYNNVFGLSFKQSKDNDGSYDLYLEKYQKSEYWMTANHTANNTDDRTVNAFNITKSGDNYTCNNVDMPTRWYYTKNGYTRMAYTRENTIILKDFDKMYCERFDAYGTSNLYSAVGNTKLTWENDLRNVTQDTVKQSAIELGAGSKVTTDWFILTKSADHVTIFRDGTEIIKLDQRDIYGNTFKNQKISVQWIEDRVQIFFMESAQAGNYKIYGSDTLFGEVKLVSHVVIHGSSKKVVKEPLP